MPLKTKPYPFDYDKLDIGSYIPPEDVEDVLTLKKENKDYALKAHALGKQIEQALMQRNIDVYVCMKGYGLLLMGSEDASAYARRMSKNYLNRFRAVHKNAMRVVKPDELSAEEGARYDKDILQRAFIIQSIRKSRQKKVIAGFREEQAKIAEKRSTKKLPKPEGNGDG